MTKDPFTVSPDGRCLDVLRDMRSRRFRHAPVVEDGRLIGLVSERDLLRALPHLVGDLEADKGQQNMKAPVRSVMIHEVKHCSPSDPVDMVARQMLEKRLGCMAVVADGELVGIVTTNDLLRGFTDHLSTGDTLAMTFLWTRGKLSTAPDVTALAAAAGVHVVAYFVTETDTGALALMVRALGTEKERASFVDACIGAGLLLMSTRSAA